MTKRYKITVLAAAAVAFALFSAGNSFAASGGCGDMASESFTCTYSGVTADSQNNATIAVTLSPGVQLKYQSRNVAGGIGDIFGLETINTAVNAVNRNEYGFASDYSGFFMKPNPSDTTYLDDIVFSGTPVTANSAFSGWTAMGGSS